MKKLLILGGTKFVGLKLLNLLNDENIDYYVASRKRIKVEHFIFFDRKNIYDLNKLFSEHNFDVIIDFISYSSLDSKILIDSLKYLILFQIALVHQNMLLVFLLHLESLLNEAG